MESLAQLSAAQRSSAQLEVGIVLFRGQSCWGSAILEVSAMVDRQSLFPGPLQLHVLVIMAEEEVIGCCSFT